MKRGTYEFHRNQWRKWGKGRVKSRIALGVCVSCDRRPGLNPRTGRPFVRCEEHRTRAGALQNKTRAELAAHWRAHGNCIICGKPCGKNPRTGLKFVRCLKHRLINAKAAERQRAKNNSV